MKVLLTPIAAATLACLIGPLHAESLGEKTGVNSTPPGDDFGPALCRSHATRAEATAAAASC